MTTAILCRMADVSIPNGDRKLFIACISWQVADILRLGMVMSIHQIEAVLSDIEMVLAHVDMEA